MDFSSDGAGGSLTESPLGAIARGKIVALRCEGERGVPTCARVLHCCSLTTTTVEGGDGLMRAVCR